MPVSSGIGSVVAPVRVNDALVSLSPADKIYLAGHSGLVGSAIMRHLHHEGYRNIVTASSGELDLREHSRTDEFVGDHRPDVVIMAAARVGGIGANAAAPADFLSDNLRIQSAIFDAARRWRVRRLLFLGSSCIYPRLAAQPITESALLTGPLEPTNDGYAIAKIAGITMVRSVRRQDGLPWISAMPTNLYGPGDCFDLERAHVLPALIRRFHEARESSATHVTIWGTGAPRREFLHVDDLAAACLTLLREYGGAEPINVGAGTDLPIADLARTIADVIGYRGDIRFDRSRPDGTPRKLLDVSRISALGWRPAIDLVSGIKATYEWFLDNAVQVGR